jgi:streptopain
MKYSKLILLLFIIAFNSCSTEIVENDAIQVQLENSIDTDSNFVNLSEVKGIANEIFSSSKKMLSKGTTKKQIKEIKPISDHGKQTSYYIINYEGGGFIIISADKRVYPILAFSNENNFDLNSEYYPGLLVNWLFGQDNYVNKLRDGKIKEVYNLEDHWKVSAIENRIISAKQNLDFKTTETRNYTLISSHGPLISTSWGQGLGYNNSAPYGNCSDYSNGRTPTGCVATAMSQIMKFHNYPSNYNWSIMPNHIYSSTTTSSGANEISRLMRDAGNYVGMDWGCELSGADTEDAANALKNNFGYQSANYSDDYTNLINDVQSGYPVILKGGRAEDWILFKIYRDGHAWICDGFESAKIEVYAPAGRWGFIWRWVNLSSFHMNWGWNGSWNGWYSGLNNSVGDFSYESGVIYNIRK